MMWQAISVYVSLLVIVQSHVITTPRKWTSEAPSQICVTLTSTNTNLSNDHLSLYLKDGSKTLLETSSISLPGKAGESLCSQIDVPSGIKISELDLEIKGVLEGSFVKYNKRIAIITPRKSYKPYIQTDKYTYKPAQTVNIRVLTIRGPYMDVFTGKYPEIWIENPEHSRLKQWLNVYSPGLIHLSFRLPDEPMEGKYTVNTKLNNVKSKQSFVVKEYVLPRYEVTIKPPGYIFGDATSFSYIVCARYTFGQPVKGQATLELTSISSYMYYFDYYQDEPVPLYINEELNGCHTFNISKKTISSLMIDGQLPHTIEALATVTEQDTAVSIDSRKIKTEVSTVAVSFNEQRSSRYLKPGLPFIAEIKATFPDGSPATRQPMEVCSITSEICKQFKSNKKGVFKFALPPHIQEDVEIKAVNFRRVETGDRWGTTLMVDSNYKKEIEVHHSPSNSSLQIFLSSKKLKCPPRRNIELDIPVWFSVPEKLDTQVTLQVISRGQIVHTHTTTYSLSHKSSPLMISSKLYLQKPADGVTTKSIVGSFRLRAFLPRTVSPSIKILVWYTREDGEVVSDFQEMSVSNCLLNDASLDWSVDKAYPGDETTLTLTAYPYSLCSIGVVDKSTEILKKSPNDLSPGKLLRTAKMYDTKSDELTQLTTEAYCSKFYASLKARRRREASFIFEDDGSSTIYKTSGTDSLGMFNDAGIYALSDLDLEFRECHKQTSHSYSPYEPALYGNGEYYYDTPDYSLISNGDDMVSNFVEPKLISSPKRKMSPPQSTPSEDSAFEDQTRSYFPETWLWDLIVIQKNGVHSSNLTLPDTVTKWMGKAVCVHPTAGVGISKASSITTFRNFFIDLTLPATAKRGELLPFKISVFNYLQESLPVQIKLIPTEDYEIVSTKSSTPFTADERLVCVESQGKHVETVMIRPTSQGLINLTVEATANTNLLMNCMTTLNIHRRDVVIKELKVDFEGFPKEETYSEYICVKGNAGSVSWNLISSAGIVDGSTRAFVSLAGDLIGPTIENLGGLVSMPYGCGEQNMVKFAPNIFVMQYLESSSQLEQELTNKIITHLETGYARELNYRHTDGSYSAFGGSDPSGSTWLTSFVLKCFSQARPYITIDPADLMKSTTWLKSLQKDDGCFRSVGKVYNKGLKGGIGSINSERELTSFVLVSLLEAGESPSERFVSNALSCMRSSTSTEPYALALKAYAFALAKEPSSPQILDQLLQKTTDKNGLLEWKSQSNEMSDALSLETSGYAVLALMEAGDVDTASKFIRSMNSKRNGQGGFISTQDTIVALQAMSSFERGQPQHFTDLEIVIDYNGTKESSFKINQQNKLLMQRTAVPYFPATVSVDVIGTGCALVQAVLRYNMPKPDLAKAFSMTVNSRTIPDRGCKTKGIRVCASYQLPDLASNMAIVEVDLMTGYIPDKTSLKSIIGGGSGTFKRYEVDGSKVSFYLDELTSQEACLDFKVLREFEVQDAKNGTVSLYDYYSPEFAIGKSYMFPTDCILIP